MHLRIGITTVLGFGIPVAVLVFGAHRKVHVRTGAVGLQRFAIVGIIRAGKDPIRVGTAGFPIGLILPGIHREAVGSQVRYIFLAGQGDEHRFHKGSEFRHAIASGPDQVHVDVSDKTRAQNPEDGFELPGLGTGPRREGEQVVQYENTGNASEEQKVGESGDGFVRRQEFEDLSDRSAVSISQCDPGIEMGSQETQRFMIDDGEDQRHGMEGYQHSKQDAANVFGSFCGEPCREYEQDQKRERPQKNPVQVDEERMEDVPVRLADDGKPESVGAKQKGETKQGVRDPDREQKRRGSIEPGTRRSDDTS